MPPLTDDQRQDIESRLARREAELQQEVRDAHAAAAANDPAADGPAPVDDAVAMGQERLRTGLDHVELQRDQEELRAIDAARVRIADGDYGRCVDCGCEIPLERLQAQPTAERCVPCQTAWERTHDAAPRMAT